MKREFYIDTPLGKLRVWAKHDVDSALDFPGVNIDLIDEKDGDIIVAVVEYDSTDKRIQTCVYGDVDREDPTHIVELQNLPTLEEELKPYLMTVVETSCKDVIVYARSADEARTETQTLWDLQEIELTADDFSEMELLTPQELNDTKGYEYCTVYNQPEDKPPRSNLEVLKDLIDYTQDMERDWNAMNDPEPNVWSDDVRALRWAFEKLGGIDI